jgi:hypothetical protein
MMIMRTALMGLAISALTGCSFEGPWLQTWWGDLAAEDPQVSFEVGSASALRGLAFEQALPDGTSGTGVVLVGSWAPASCDTYVDHMRELDALRDAAADVPLDADSAAWICERLQGLALETYGDTGDHRAVHIVVGSGMDGEDRLAPASEDVALDELGALDLTTVPGTGTFAARVLEWGSPQLPDMGVDASGRCTGAVLGAWASEDATAADGVVAGAFRVYSHRFQSGETVPQTGGEPAPVGLATEDWANAAEGGASAAVTVFTDAPAIAGNTFPQMAAGTRGETVPLAACDAAATYSGWAFPELVEAAP